MAAEQSKKLEKVIAEPMFERDDFGGNSSNKNRSEWENKKMEEKKKKKKLRGKNIESDTWMTPS